MAPNSPRWFFIHTSMAGSRSTAPLNRSSSCFIAAPPAENMESPTRPANEILVLPPVPPLRRHAVWSRRFVSFSYGRPLCFLLWFLFGFFSSRGCGRTRSFEKRLQRGSFQIRFALQFYVTMQFAGALEKFLRVRQLNGIGDAQSYSRFGRHDHADHVGVFGTVAVTDDPPFDINLLGDAGNLEHESAGCQSQVSHFRTKGCQKFIHLFVRQCPVHLLSLLFARWVLAQRPRPTP